MAKQVTIRVYGLTKETAKAVRVVVESGSAGSAGKRFEAWLPKSQVADVWKAEGEYFATIPSWLARKNGIHPVPSVLGIGRTGYETQTFDDIPRSAGVDDFQNAQATEVDRRFVGRSGRLCDGRRVWVEFAPVAVDGYRVRAFRFAPDSMARISMGIEWLEDEAGRRVDLRALGLRTEEKGFPTIVSMGHSNEDDALRSVVDNMRYYIREHKARSGSLATYREALDVFTESGRDWTTLSLEALLDIAEATTGVRELAEGGFGDSVRIVVEAAEARAAEPVAA